MFGTRLIGLMAAHSEIAVGHEVGRVDLVFIVPLLNRVEVPLDLQIRLVDLVARLLPRSEVIVVALRTAFLGLQRNSLLVPLYLV